ncbi:UNKNOWN [Stylonychia lemnae]|uniref:MORN repeat-containing protein 3 n=1 Tax=Stylonychia lemnae TaxID=5949 RepID=A0A078A4J4_STYLE|nr:UNKNOWN [Stylonychia lemnae]|eukprot:CDW75684.1 UNKNOWN [Stylonychia lemnae]
MLNLSQTRIIKLYLLNRQKQREQRQFYNPQDIEESKELRLKIGGQMQSDKITHESNKSSLKEIQCQPKQKQHQSNKSDLGDLKQMSHAFTKTLIPQQQQNTDDEETMDLSQETQDFRDFQSLTQLIKQKNRMNQKLKEETVIEIMFLLANAILFILRQNKPVDFIHPDRIFWHDQEGLMKIDLRSKRVKETILSNTSIDKYQVFNEYQGSTKYNGKDLYQAKEKKEQVSLDKRYSNELNQFLNKLLCLNPKDRPTFLSIINSSLVTNNRKSSIESNHKSTINQIQNYREEIITQNKINIKMITPENRSYKILANKSNIKFMSEKNEKFYSTLVIIGDKVQNQLNEEMLTKIITEQKTNYQYDDLTIFQFIRKFHPNLIEKTSTNQGCIYWPQEMIETSNILIYSHQNQYQLRHNSNDQAKTLIIYDGQLNDHDLPHGEGKMFYMTGSLQYEGLFENGLYGPVGTLLYLNGKINYHGNFKAGLKDGQGDLYYQHGQLSYTGSFIKNKRSGKGISYHANGDIDYSGDWIDNMKEGYGISYYRDQSIEYQGFWKSSLWDGKGMFHDYDKENIIIYQGQFKKGIREGEFIVMPYCKNIHLLCDFQNEQLLF